jgi:hypothetical protein
VQFKVDGGDIWLSANRSGWLHLARICAEMGLHTESANGYHFHRGYACAPPLNGRSLARHAGPIQSFARVFDRRRTCGVTDDGDGVAAQPAG